MVLRKRFKTVRLQESAHTPERGRRYGLGRAALCCLAVALSAGCGHDSTPRLADYLEEMDFESPLKSAAYVSLGKFDVPIALPPAEGEQDVSPIWVRLRFTLDVETDPESKSAVRAAARRRRGSLNDAVITIVRGSTKDEIADHRLAALKGRITEVARPLLGADGARQFLINDSVTEPL